MKRLIIASNNINKVKEIRHILGNDSMEILSLQDVKVFIDVDEDGRTYEENAYKKAKEIRDYLINRGEKDFCVMADDSGLEVDYLNGEPGIYSARYSGEDGNDEKNNKKLLEKLKDIPREQRTANFKCCIVILNDDNKELINEVKVEGIITEELKGNNGFGYDQLFYIENVRKTFAEMSDKEKNSISHRGKALEMISEQLKSMV